MTRGRPDAQELLDERDPRRSWSRFLEHHADTIYRAAARACRDPEEGRDVAAEVLRRLAERWPAILERFELRPDGPRASFRTWLAVVARNLAIDVLRSLHGRAWLPRPIARLPEWQQELYRLVHRDGLSSSDAYGQLVDAGLFAGDFGQLCAELATIEELLPAPAVRGGARRIEVSAELQQTAADGGDEPEARALRAERRAALGATLAAMSAEDRGLLRAYYLDGVSAEELRPLLGGRTRSQVYHRVRGLLEQLRTELSGRGVKPGDVAGLADFDWRASLEGGA